MNDNITIGTVVTSKAGRDKKRSFIVMDILDEQYVLLADGCLRKIENPKKKKIKHLFVEKTVIDSIKLKLTEKKQVFNAEIRNCLLSAGYNHDKIDEEDQLVKGRSNRC